MKKIIFVIFTLCILGGITACSKAEEPPIPVAETLQNISIPGSGSGIVPIPAEAPPVLKNLFNRYTRIPAPNGNPIHLLAQAGWTDDQIIKARSVLQHMLSDFPGSVYGHNKTAVANALAERNATMILFNTEEELEAAFDTTPLGRVDLSMQDLRANECPADGSEDYMNHITRDASFEEIWHLVHDYGIKTTLPGMIAEMRAANDAAAKKGWRAWPEDEPWEHPNEYVGVLLDNYLDLWTVRPQKYEGRPIGPKDVPQGTSHFGRYFANSREELRKMDPAGYALVEKFFHPYLTYTVQLPVDFSGAFSLTFDKNKVYTYKSRYLKNVTLRGNNNVNLIGNELDNKLTGNDGDNQLTGGPGSDVLDGGGGEDTAIFSGNHEEYTIKKEAGKTIVSDQKNNRDGNDTLVNIEFLRFSNRRVKL